MFETGINFNTDLSISSIIKGVKIAEEYGYDYIWIGEAFQYSHPIPIAALISKVTKKIKVGIIVSPKIDKCIHIIKSIQVLQEAYGERYAIGLIPGDPLRLKTLGLNTFNILEDIKSCIKSFPRVNLKIKSEFKDSIPKLCKLTSLPIYVGASGPKMINEGSKIADGLLLNYINPEFIKWALEFVDVKNCCIAAFGPVLLKPATKELLMALRISAAVVAAGANKSLIKEFNMHTQIEEIKKIFEKNEFNALESYDEFLINKFAVYGDIEEIKSKIEELRKIGVDQVVFGTPFCKDFEAIKKLGEALKK
jgi:5,10-methylenetetrahydromethanopterin reductase